MHYTSSTIPPELFALLPDKLKAQVPLYDETALARICAALAVCLFVAFSGLGLRIYARKSSKQALGLDDVFAAIASVFTTVAIGLMAYLTHLGVGRHDVVLVTEHIEDFNMLIKTLVVSCVMYAPVIFCVKASVIFLYRRIFPNKQLRVVCYAVLFFTAAYALAALLTITVSCLPSHPPTAEEPIAYLSCSNQYLGNALLVILITNVVLDAFILCLPLPLIWRLKTNLKKKLQLTLVFTLGSFIFVISIIRVIAVKRLDSSDDNWDSTDLELWSIAESSLGIFTVSLPVMHPVLRRAVYRQDGSLRFTAAPNTNPLNQDETSRVAKLSPLLTFGRSAFKAPKGRCPLGLDALTLSTTPDVNTRLNGSVVTSQSSGRHGNGPGHLECCGKNTHDHVVQSRLDPV